MANIFLFLGLTLVYGTAFPETPTAANWFWLGISGLVGLVVGDLFYFTALNRLGARLTMLLLSLSPPFAALSAWIMMSEKISPLGFLGMFVTLFGISVVISERKPNGIAQKEEPLSKIGLWAGVGAAICQAIGMVFSKMGLEGINPVTGTFMRMNVAFVAFLAYLIFTSNWKAFIGLKDKKGLLYAIGGSFFGPSIGVSLSLVAVKHTSAGIAMTLLSTTPITILPYAVLINKERLSLRAILGAAIAVIGVSMLFLR